MLLVAALASLGAAVAAQSPTPAVVTIAFEDVRALVPSLLESLPAALTGKTGPALESAWTDWISRHVDDVRARLDRGDEDSIVNFWLYGTSFTRQPPARERDLARVADQTTSGEVLQARLDDLIDHVSSPGGNERLQFAAEFFRRRGIDPAARAGRDRAKMLLADARTRALGEFGRTDQALQSARRRNDPAAELAAHSTIFQDRGLSSDTSLLVDFAIDHALAALKAGGALTAGSVRRVAVVGPGLDFVNKADGHDFYPQQTVQPFAVIDSLRRLGLAAPDNLFVTTLDVSARVNRHLEVARENSRAGKEYALHLPLSRDERWVPDLIAYWRQFGGTIGINRRPDRVPALAGVDVRALTVKPEIVRSIVPRDVDIVIEALKLPADDRFDLVVATNVFVYYNRFEQALAVANVAKMLRPGGILLSNNDVSPSSHMNASVGYLLAEYSDRQRDQVFSLQRR